jgi:hypothetical protein
MVKTTISRSEFFWIRDEAERNGDAQAQGFNDHEEAQEAHRAAVRAKRKAQWTELKGL